MRSSTLTLSLTSSGALTEPIVGTIRIEGPTVAFRSNEQVYDFRARLDEISPYSTLIMTRSPIQPDAVQVKPYLNRDVPIERGAGTEPVVRILNSAKDEWEQVMNIVDAFRPLDVRAARLAELWSNAKSANLSPQEKGNALEDLFQFFVNSDEGFIVIDRQRRTNCEEIDLVVKNRSVTGFLATRSPLILVECKNWSTSVGPKEVRDLAGKIENRHRFVCEIGLLVATSGFSEGVHSQLSRYREKPWLIAIANGSDIEEAVTKNVSFSQFLRDRIIEYDLVKKNSP